MQGAGGSLYSSDNTAIYPAAKAIVCGFRSPASTAPSLTSSALLQLIVGFLIQIIALFTFFVFAIICEC